MAAAMILAVLGALGCSRLVAGSEGPGGPVALVQSSVRVHGASAWHTAKGNYLVNNTLLQHKGPGVLLRLSRNLSDVAGRDQYLPWGTVFDGLDTADGWIRYKNYFLPTHVRGVRVITAQDMQANLREVQATMEELHPKRKTRVHIRYAPTEFQAQDGSWVPCRIVSLGSKPNAYNIEVKPRRFSPYNVTNVPAESLKKVQRIREFIPVKAPPKDTSSATKLARTAQETEPSVRLRVNSTKAGLMDLRMFKRSPMRTMMKMACERAKVSWFKCQRHVTFLWNKNPVHETHHTDDLGINDGDTVMMVGPS